jgi:hypothetical protein
MIHGQSKHKQDRQPTLLTANSFDMVVRTSHARAMAYQLFIRHSLTYIPHSTDTPDTPGCPHPVVKNIVQRQVVFTKLCDPCFIKCVTGNNAHSKTHTHSTHAEHSDKQTVTSHSKSLIIAIDLPFLMANDCLGITYK